MRVRFGEFALDTETRELTRDGAVRPLTAKAFDLLAMLVANRPRIVSKTDLQERLWPDRFVVEKNLANLVGEIRTALGESATAPRFIRTAHRVGYAFRGAGETKPPRTLSPTSGPHACRLIWQEHRLTLDDGDHVLGREPAADIYLDATNVSRRHAVIRIADGAATLQDLGSKNGTFIGGKRVDGMIALRDGDRIQIGSVVMTFRVIPGTGSTRTTA